MDNQTKSLLARILPILFFLGFIGPKDNYVSFHCNQALIQFLMGIVGSLIGKIPYVGGILSGLIGLFSFVCWILGIVAVCKREMRPLPLVGNIRLIG